MRFFQPNRVAVLIAILALVSPMALHAQTIVTGAVGGAVTDPTGAAVADAVVALKNAATGEEVDQKTSSTGAYLFPLLKPGSYTVGASHTGFKLTVLPVLVQLGQTTTANIQLVIGSASATVEVTAEVAPLIQTEDANISTVFNSTQFQQIPNPGNDITYVVQTAPGVVMNNSTVGGYGNFSAFGLPADANLFTVNGNDYNDPFLNLNNSGASNLLLGGNDIQEAVVVVNGYTGQYGRQAGAQVDYTTMSGSNQWHGRMNYDWTGRALNANDPINKLSGGARPFENNNEWAAGLGGPIVKDKLFFWVDTEGIRYIFGSTANVVAPTPAFQSYVLGNLTTLGASPATMAFYNNAFKLYNGAGGITRAAPDAGSCGSIPASSFAGPCTESWTNSLSNGNKEWLLIGRMDYVASNSDKIFGRVKFDRGLQPTYTDPINPIFNNQSTQPQDEGQLNWSHTFSPTVLNSFVGSLLYYSAIFESQNYPGALGLFPGNLLFLDGNTATTGAISALGTGSGSPNGYAAGFVYPQGRNVTQYQLVDDLSVTRGNHDFKMGVNFRRDDVSDFQAESGTLYPVVQTTMFGFANDQISPATGAPFPGSVVQNFANSPVQPIAMYSFGLYFQDEFRVNSRLKLTMAMRAERNSGGACQHSCASTTFLPFNTMSHSADIPYIDSFSPGQTSILPSVEGMVWEPRLGVAWTPFDENTVIRGGVGLFTDLYPGEILGNITTNFPQVNLWNVDPGTSSVAFGPGFTNSGPAFVANCNSTFSSNYKAGGTLANYVGAAPACASALPNYFGAPAKFLNPKYLEWNLEIQHKFASNLALTVDYVGDHGYDELLLDPYMNSFCDPVNCQPMLGANTGLPTTAPDPRVATVQQGTNNGYSNYNGVTFSLQEIGWHGLTGALNYTYSHSLDNASNGGVNPFAVLFSITNQISPFNPNAAYGASDYDARHNVTANYIYALPFKSGNRMLNAAIGGWQISGDFFFRTGFPFTPVDGLTSAILGPTDNLVGSTIILQPNSSFTQRSFGNGRACAQWLVGGNTCFSQANFAAATGFTGSAIGRNGFRGPGFFGSDFSLRKEFQLTERLTFQIGLNAFNVFNHDNIGDPYASTYPILPFGGSYFTQTPPTSPYGAFAAAATDMRMAQIVGTLKF